MKGCELQAFEMAEISKLTPYPRNTKCHSRIQINRIAASIKNYGYDVPIVVDENFMILKGNGRYEALKALGRDTVPIIMKEGLSEAEKSALSISDNKLSESDWDVKKLLDEILEIGEFFSIKDLGFDDKSLDKLLDGTGFEEVRLPDYSPKSEKDAKKTELEIKRAREMYDEDGRRNPYYGESSLILEMDNKELYEMDEQSFFDYHDDIIVGFSSGKDSMASALYVFEKNPPEKIHLVFADLGWRVDWPHMHDFTVYFEDFVKKKYDWPHSFHRGKTHTSLRLENDMIQQGYPLPRMCFVRNNFKIAAIDKAVRDGGFLKNDGKKRMRVIGFRWEESENRNKDYPLRGKLSGTPFNYSSPIIDWTDRQVGEFVVSLGAKLSPLYKYAPRGGCMMCPSSGRADIIATKLRYPESYKKIMEWHGLAARKRNMFSKFVDRFLVLPDEVNMEHINMGTYLKDYAMDEEELTQHMERITGKKLPRPYYS